MNAPLQHDILDHHLRQAAIAGARKPTGEFPHSQILLKWANPAEIFEADQHGAGKVSGRGSCRTMKPAPGFLVEAGAEKMPEMSEGHGGSAKPCQRGAEPRETASWPAVVGIEESEIFAASSLHAPVARRTDTRIVLADGANCRKSGLGCGKRTIAGTVIDDDHVQTMNALSVDAGQSLADIRCLVMDRNDDADLPSSGGRVHDGTKGGNQRPSVEGVGEAAPDKPAFRNPSNKYSSAVVSAMGQ
jgi:hypothetical protein